MTYQYIRAVTGSVGFFYASQIWNAAALVAVTLATVCSTTVTYWDSRIQGDMLVVSEMLERARNYQIAEGDCERLDANVFKRWI
jgi:hypothetical protein